MRAAGAKIMLSLEGYDGIVAALRSTAPAEARAAVREALRSAGGEMVQAAKGMCPSEGVRDALGLVLRYQPRKMRILAVLGPRYGFMVNERRTVSINGHAARRTVSNQSAADKQAARISHLLEFGTRPHWIQAATAPQRSVNENGQLVQQVGIRRTYMHPGTTARPFMRPAWEAGKYRFIDRAREFLAGACEKIAAYGRYRKTGRAYA
jgi:hypothetical protein